MIMKIVIVFYKIEIQMVFFKKSNTQKEINHEIYYNIGLAVRPQVLRL